MLCGGRTHIQCPRVHMKGTIPDISDTEMKKALHFSIRGSNLCSIILVRLSKSAKPKNCAVSPQVVTVFLSVLDLPITAFTGKLSRKTFIM